MAYKEMAHHAVWSGRHKTRPSSPVAAGTSAGGEGVVLIQNARKQNGGYWCACSTPCGACLPQPRGSFFSSGLPIPVHSHCPPALPGSALPLSACTALGSFFSSGLPFRRLITLLATEGRPVAAWPMFLYLAYVAGVVFLLQVCSSGRGP